MVITLLTVILTFNIVIRVYAQNIAQKELLNTVTSVELLIKQQVSLGGLSQETILDKLKLIRRTLRISSISSSTEFIIVDGKGTVRFPVDLTETFLTTSLMTEATKATSGIEPGSLGSFRHTGTKYFVTYKSLAGNRAASYKLIFLSNSNALRTIIRTMNIVLGLIIIVATTLGSLVTLKLSKSISKPISELSKHAKEIGEGHFLRLPTDESTVEIHELTNSMNEMSKRLTDFDRTQKTFLQNASHEIRTPLMSIQGYAEGIAKGIFSDTIQPAEIICEESKRLNHLVEDLLTLSRIENNAYVNDFHTLNIADAIKEYVQKINGYALKENIKLDLSILQEEVTVRANEELLSQAVMNILSNSIKYARQDVHVLVDRRGDQVLIQIRDDGDGISEKDLPYIFDRFYKGKKGNFGLGLSIAHSAIATMQGALTAYNKNGAVFEIRIPLYVGPFMVK